MMTRAHTRVFISYSTINQEFVDKLVEVLRDHYIMTWYAPRNIEAGLWEERITEALRSECDWFLVVLSPASLGSDYVRWETELAMADDRFIRRVLPVLAEPCDWKSLHEKIGRYQLLDNYTDSIEAETRLLNYLGVDRHKFSPIRVGDVKIPVHIFVGGDGQTVFRQGDIICDGPGSFTNSSRIFELKPELEKFADSYIPKREEECHKKGIIFVNNPQVRLMNAVWGSSNERGGIDNRPLRLELGWTWYNHTVITNNTTDELLADGKTIGQKYAAPIDNLYNCGLSNPIAVNLSIITEDNYIFYGQRSSRVQTLPGGYQPAVSGTGQSEDLDDKGVYNPFQTALREATEECIGNLQPAPTADDVIFFGLGRWMKTRFPFLFGEIRLKEVTMEKVLSNSPTNQWEGVREPLPFDVDSVTKWCANQYREQYYGRGQPANSATIFSLLQSLRYAYPEKWPEIIDRLKFTGI
jgi:hypothetical protein